MRERLEVPKPMSEQSKQRSIGHKPAPIVRRLQEALAERGIPDNCMRALISRKCGVSYQSIHHWFNGRTSIPRADHLAIVAEEFELDLTWLILGKSVKTESDRDGSAFS